MRHAGGARRENREVEATLLLQLDLAGLDRLADLVVGDLEFAVLRAARGIDHAGELGVTEDFKLWRRGGVVAMDVDDHSAASLSSRSTSERLRTVARAGRRCGACGQAVRLRFVRGH